jgi:hypothetical protein
MPRRTSMMAASPNEVSRRRTRYTRQITNATSALTPIKLRLLQQVSDYRIASLPQLAVLCELSAKSARRYLRDLFDGGLVQVVAVPRAALAELADDNTPSLLFGSAPNLYVLTQEGSKALYALGLTDAIGRGPRYGPKNSLFLAHELAIGDLRVWLTRCSRQQPGQLLAQWKGGEDAAIMLDTGKPAAVLRPDAWFIYQLGSRVLVGLLEVDRGTERGARRWSQKVASYEQLFSSGRLKDVTGYANARVLVTTPSEARRDHLAALIERLAPPPLHSRFWLAIRAELMQSDFAETIWIQPGSTTLRPLMPRDVAEYG